MLSTHRAEVVPVKLENHPDADSLSIVRFDGFNVCVRTQDWIGIDKAIHILPESIVDTTRPEFAFLSDDKKDKIRVKAKKLRGVFSYGFLIPAPPEAKIGEDCGSTLSDADVQIDHIVPASTATTEKDIKRLNQLNNLRLICSKCNQKRVMILFGLFLANLRLRFNLIKPIF